MLVCDRMIPTFLLNKLISKILSLVLEKTGEDHSRLQDQLHSLENELNDIKQSIDINSVKNTIEQQGCPNITINHITIEAITIDQANLSVDLERLIKSGSIDQQMINQAAFVKPTLPKINFQTKRK